MKKLALLLVLAACAAPPVSAQSKACEPLEPDEKALIGRPGYDPDACTRVERTAKMKVTFDEGVFNGRRGADAAIDGPRP